VWVQKKFANTSGVEHMTTDSHAKKRGTKLTAAEKKQARLDANRKAQLQWYIVAGVLVLAVVAAIVLVTVFTDGEIFIFDNPNG